MPADIVVFNGITFRRYPDSKNWADSHYYKPAGNERKRGTGALHQEVWKSVHGPIPEGYHIHHKDEDTLNNDISNLEARLVFDHLSGHGHIITDDQRRLLDTIRPLAAEWHRSDEGRAWHRANGIKHWQSVISRPHVCELCGQHFESRAIQAVRFCSNRCKAKWRRDTGADDEDRTCVWCGDSFRVNRFDSASACSQVCAQRYRRRVVEPRSSL